MQQDFTFADISDVEERLGRELTDSERVMCAAKLADVTALIETDLAVKITDADNVPAFVRGMAAQAVARWLLNPSGIKQSTSDGQSVVLDPGTRGGDVWISDDDIARLRAMGKPADADSAKSLHTVGTYTGWTPGFSSRQLHGDAMICAAAQQGFTFTAPSGPYVGWWW